MDERVLGEGVRSSDEQEPSCVGVIGIAHSCMLVTDGHQSGSTSQEGDAKDASIPGQALSGQCLGMKVSPSFLSET